MGKLNLTVDLDNLTEKERENFFKLVEKSKKKSFNPFERVETNKSYYYINDWSQVKGENEVRLSNDIAHFTICNYYNDKEFAKHQALRELLNRKLIKFSYENGGAEIVINQFGDIFEICYNQKHNVFLPVIANTPEILTPLTPLFISREVAEKAIDEVVKPFMEKHPDFKWWG